MASRIPPVGNLNSSETVRKALLDLDRRIGATEGRLGLNNDDTVRDQGLGSLRFNFTGTSDPETTTIYSTGSSYGAGDGIYMDASGRVSFGTKFVYNGDGTLTISGTVTAEEFSLLNPDGNEVGELTVLDVGDPIAERNSLKFLFREMGDGTNRYGAIEWRDSFEGLNFRCVDASDNETGTAALGTYAFDLDFVDAGIIVASYQFDRNGKATIPEIDAVSGDITTMTGDTLTATGQVQAASFRGSTNGFPSTPLYTGTDNDTGLYFVTNAAFLSAQGSWKIGVNSSGTTLNDSIFLNGYQLEAGGAVFVDVNEIVADIGSATDPSYTFDGRNAGGSAVGMYSDSADNLCFTAGGVLNGRISSTQVAFPNIWTTAASGANPVVHVMNATGKLGYVSSQRAHKKNIESLTLAEAEKMIGRSRPVAYERRDSGVAEIGLIAEEVDLVDPRLTCYEEDGTPKSVSYGSYVMPLLKVVQDLMARVEELENQ